MRDGAQAIRQPVQPDKNNLFKVPSAAGGAYQRSRVKSVRRTFRFLLQQRLSVSLSDGLNEGLVSRATSTKPGVCVYHQSTLVSTAGHVHSSPPPSTPLSLTNGHIYRSEPQQLPPLPHLHPPLQHSAGRTVQTHKKLHMCNRMQPTQVS